MSTEIKTNMAEHSAIEYWGGPDKGVCIQITFQGDYGDRLEADRQGFVQFTMEDAAEAIYTLSEFVRREAVRRQSLLKKQLESLKLAERTVFHEVTELPSQYFAAPMMSVTMVSKLCPRFDDEAAQ